MWCLKEKRFVNYKMLQGQYLLHIWALEQNIEVDSGKNFPLRFQGQGNNNPVAKIQCFSAQGSF